MKKSCNLWFQSFSETGIGKGRYWIASEIKTIQLINNKGGPHKMGLTYVGVFCLGKYIKAKRVNKYNNLHLSASCEP